MNRDNRYDDRGRYPPNEPYRRPFNHSRSPPRRDGFRAGRSPPRDSRSDRFGGSPPGRSNRRSRSPIMRGRDPSPRGSGFNEWKARERSPVRRWSPRRDAPRRDERPRSRSPRGPGRSERPRSPPRRGRDPSPGFRGRRSPPPVKRERYVSPARGRYDRPRSPPPEQASAPEDRHNWRARSPRNDRRNNIEGRQWGARSPSPRSRNQRFDDRNSAASGHNSGRNSGNTSRISSPPVHPSRIPLQPGYNSRDRSPGAPPTGPSGRRARSPVHAAQYSRPMSPKESSPGWANNRRARSPPRPNARPRSPPHQPAYDSRDRQYPMRDRSPPQKRVDDYPRNDGPQDRKQSCFDATPERGPRANGFSQSLSREPPTGPSRRYDSPVSTPPTGPATSVPVSSAPPPRSGNVNLLSAPREPRGGGGGRVIIPRRESHHNGPPPEFRRGGPSGYSRGPRPSFGGPPMFRSNNSSSTTYPRSQRFNNPLNDLPRILPGGKTNPAFDVSDKLKKLEADKQKLEEVLAEKETKKRAALRDWDRLERDSMRETLRAELADEQIKTLSGEGGSGGSAF